MQLSVIRAKINTDGVDVSGDVVTMDSGTTHIIRTKDLPYYQQHSDAFEVVSATPALLLTDANSNITGLAAQDGAKPSPLVFANVNPDRRENGSLICNWGSSGTLSTTGSTGTGFAFALDTTVILNGKPAVKCTFPSDASAQTFIGTWTPTNPIRLRDVEVIHVPVLYTSNYSAGGVGNPFQVWLGTSSGKSIRLQLSWANGTNNPALGAAGNWHTYSFGRGAAAITGTGSMSDLDTASETITTVKIVQATTGAAANTNPVWVGEIRADCKRGNGYVSIVLDGEYSSQYDTMQSIFAANGIRASLAIVTDAIGDSGRMTEAQIDELYQYGHECIHHTYGASTHGYVNATDWATALLIAEDIRAQWDYFRTKGWTRGIGYGVWGYAYTFESNQTQTRQNLVRDALRHGGLTAVRKSAAYNGDDALILCPLHRMPVDPLVVPGAIQVTSTHTLQDLKDCVDNAESTGQWAILTFHRTAASPGSLETTPAIFKSFVEYAASRQLAGGPLVLPFGEVYSKTLATNEIV